MVELLVENKSLDLYEGEVMSITMAVNDMASIESREGNYSNKFSVPSTSKNNAIFGYPNELNFVTGFKPTKSRNASILIDGLEVQRGFIQVEQFKQKDKEFSVSFFSGNTDWMDEIGDKSLQDITLNKYNHTWDSATVAASFANTEGYIYPFIHYGRYNSVASNNTDLINWLPAMYSHTLLKQMFADIGWKVKGNLFQDPVFLKHLLPFSLKELNYNEDQLDAIGFKSKLSADVVGYTVNTPIVFDSILSGNTLGSYNNATGVYTASASNVINVYSNVDYSGLSAGIDVRLNGVVISSGYGTAVSHTFNVIAGDTVTITKPLILGVLKEYKSRFIVTGVGDLVEGMDMQISATMPDLSQEDFLKTIFNQFGAVFTSDNISKTVYINKFEKIKDNTVNAIDWTDKLDLSREVEVDYTDLVSDYAKVNTLGYKENTDSEVVDFSSTIPAFVGNGSFNIDNDFLSKSDELFESKFVASGNLPCFNGRTSLMYVPRYSSGAIGVNSPDISPNPRCSIAVPSVSVADLFNNEITSIDIVGSSGSTNVAELPFTYFDTPLTGIDKIDSINQGLSFGDNVSPKGQRNLIETYYQDFTAILNNPRKITAYFLLNERDINNLDFLNPIYLGGELNNYFYINKVSDYRPSKRGVTKVELVLIA